MLLSLIEGVHTPSTKVDITNYFQGCSIPKPPKHFTFVEYKQVSKCIYFHATKAFSRGLWALPLSIVLQLLKIWCITTTYTKPTFLHPIAYQIYIIVIKEGLHGLDVWRWSKSSLMNKSTLSAATVNQHPPVHHPLDACYYSVVDEPQLSSNLVSPWQPIL